MSTVMSWGDNNGTRGRCDDKCHSATKPDCQCMCGGRYHGANLKPGGLRKAVEDFQEEVIREAKKRAREEGLELEIKTPETDLFGSLFWEGGK